jgi:hypothetical protein
MRVRLAGLIAVVVVSGLSLTLLGGGSGPVGPRPANCRGSFDPYRYSAAVLRACGYGVIPLVKVKTLPGGGHAYVYADRSEQLVPPAGFKPLDAATNATLTEYGLPTRPRDRAALQLWLTEMSGWTGSVAPAPFIVSDPYVNLGGLPKPVSRRGRGHTASP